MKAIQWGSSKRLLAVVALAALPLVAQIGTRAASAQTLEDAVRQAIRANEEVLSSARSRDASDQDLRQARSGYLPLIDIRAGSGYQWSPNSNTPTITANGTRGTTPSPHLPPTHLTL